MDIGMTLLHILKGSVGQAAIAGAAITVVFQGLQSRAVRRESLRREMMDLISRLDTLFRASKQVKRQLRARDVGAANLSHTRPDVIAGPIASDQPQPISTSAPAVVENQTVFIIPTAVFEEKMDQLSQLQLSLEEMRQIVVISPHLFRNRSIVILESTISYADKYLCEVIEDYERRRWKEHDHGYVVDDDSPYICDFLCKKWKSSTRLDPFEVLRRRENSEPEFAALSQILVEADSDLKIAERLGKRRTKSVCDECLRFALREMRREVLRRFGGVKIKRFLRTIQDRHARISAPRNARSMRTGGIPAEV